MTTGNPNLVDYVEYGDPVGNFSSDPEGPAVELAPKKMLHYGTVILIGTASDAGMLIDAVANIAQFLIAEDEPTYTTYGGNILLTSIVSLLISVQSYHLLTKYAADLGESASLVSTPPPPNDDTNFIPIISYPPIHMYPRSGSVVTYGTDSSGNLTVASMNGGVTNVATFTSDAAGDSGFYDLQSAGSLSLLQSVQFTDTGGSGFSTIIKYASQGDGENLSVTQTLTGTSGFSVPTVNYINTEVANVVVGGAGYNNFVDEEFGGSSQFNFLIGGSGTNLFNLEEADYASHIDVIWAAAEQATTILSVLSGTTP